MVTFNLPQNRIQGDTWHIYLVNTNTGHWTNKTVPATTRVVVYEGVQPDKHVVFFKGGQSTTGVKFAVSVWYDFDFMHSKC